MQDGKGGTVRVPYSKVSNAKQQGYQLSGGSSWTGAPQGDARRYVQDTLADPAVRKNYGDALADTPAGKVGAAIVHTAEQLGGGLRDVFVPTEAESRSRGIGIEHGMTMPGTGGPPMTQQEEAAATARSQRGLTNVIAAGGKVGFALGGPELVGLAGAAAGGDAVAIAALARIAASVGVGTGTSALAGKVSDTLNLTPEAKTLAQTAAFWAGAGLTGYAAKVEPTAGDFGAKGVKASTPGGGFSVEVGGRPTYRQPSPEGSYGEGSRVVPGKAYVRGTAGGRRFGGSPEADISAVPVNPATNPTEQKALPAPEIAPSSKEYWTPGPAGKSVQTAPPPTPPEVSLEGMDAGQATAAHPDMRPALEQATGQHQPVGTEDPASGKTIQQPTTHPAINQALATSGMPEFEKGLSDVVSSIPGAELAATRAVKDPERLAEKINGQATPAHAIKDYGAAQISVDSPAARDEVVDGLKAKYPVVDEKDQFSKGDADYGYRSHSLQVQMPSGVSMEVQIVPKEVFEANPDEHEHYTAAREAEFGGIAKSSTCRRPRRRPRMMRRWLSSKLGTKRRALRPAPVQP